MFPANTESHAQLVRLQCKVHTLDGDVGFTESIGLLVSPGLGLAGCFCRPIPAPGHDANEPTVAILLGNTLREPTDVSFYASLRGIRLLQCPRRSSSRTVRTITGGMDDVVPQRSFDELSARLHGTHDIVVAPQIVDIRPPGNAAVLEWLKQHGGGRAGRTVAGVSVRERILHHSLGNGEPRGGRICRGGGWSPLADSESRCPGFCMSFAVLTGGFLVTLLTRRGLRFSLDQAGRIHEIHASRNSLDRPTIV